MIRARFLAPFFVLLAACGSNPTTPKASTADTVSATTPSTTPPTTASTGSTAAPATASPEATVAESALTIATFQFQPNPVRTKVGASVVVTNADNTKHTVTAGTPGSPSGAFDVPLNGKGATATFAVDKAGTYAFFCAIHTSMTGEIVVS
jgi:plastocyanin